MNDHPAPQRKTGAHRVQSMRGRDPHEAHRVATPLELLFDLTFVIGIGAAAAQFARLLSEGHFASALLGFGIAIFAVCWAWVNFSWFSSAYDTDDWVFRLATMVEMIGVIILSLGVPRMFSSLDSGGRLDNGVMVLGYVVMRLAMVFLWLRAARHDPLRRRPCLTYGLTIPIAQIGWTALVLASPSREVTFAVFPFLALIELAAPVLAESKDGGTPWHAHHIAERYSLFAIIALGEGVTGTVFSVSAIVERRGWSLDAIVVCATGVGLTLGMWWMYFLVPSAEVLHKFRRRAFVWGYAHILLFAAIAATGAGLQVAGYFIEQRTEIGSVATVLATAAPVGVYILMIYTLYFYIVRTPDLLHLWLIATAALALIAAVALASLGVELTLCLAIVALAPASTVIGYETIGHRHSATALRRELRR